MQRRRISIGNRPITETHVAVAQMKAQLKERFNDSDYLDKFVEILLKSGWNSLDIDSAVRQYVNKERPAVEALTFGHEHVLDQLTLSQGVYTDFQDTAQNPNYALRHRGQSELIFRRMTPGDLMLLLAAQRSSADDPTNVCHSSDVQNYWRRVYKFLLRQMPEGRAIFAERNLEHSAFEAVVASLAFVMNTTISDFDETAEMTPEHIQQTFMDPTSRFYCGIRAVYSAQTVRVENGYEQRSNWHFERIESNDHLWMAACVVLCFGIDNVARAALFGDQRIRNDHQFYTLFINTVQRHKTTYTRDVTDGYQETSIPSSGVATSRLLP